MKEYFDLYKKFNMKYKSFLYFLDFEEYIKSYPSEKFMNLYLINDKLKDLMNEHES